MKLDERTQEIIDEINADIFGDTSASQDECIVALEEIINACEDNISAIKADMERGS